MNRIGQVFGTSPVLLAVVHPIGRGEALQREVAFADLGATAVRAVPYMDVVCTSGPGTGRAADVAKVRAMRESMGDASLALASGVTPANVRSYVPFVDAFLVGTGIEASFGVIDQTKVRAVVAQMTA